MRVYRELKSHRIVPIKAAVMALQCLKTESGLGQKRTTGGAKRNNIAGSIVHRKRSSVRTFR